jgi:Armadillo/beta-catenin-like repeat
LNVTLTMPCSPGYIENLVWLLKNLVRQPSPDFKKISIFLPLVEYLIGLENPTCKDEFDEEKENEIGLDEKQEKTNGKKGEPSSNEEEGSEGLLDSTLNIFYHICLSAEKNQKSLLEISNMSFNLIDFLITFISPSKDCNAFTKYSSPNLSKRAINIFGILLTGDDKVSQDLLNLGVLRWLINATYNESKDIRKNAFWCLGNLACCGENIIGQLYEENGFLKRIFETLESEENLKVFIS